MFDMPSQAGIEVHGNFIGHQMQALQLPFLVAFKQNRLVAIAQTKEQWAC